jgi:hypothetical protein
MPVAYTILRKLQGGELLRVATFDDLDEARQVADGLYQYWPAEYLVIAAHQTSRVQHESFYERRPPTAGARLWRN